MFTLSLRSQLDIYATYSWFDDNNDTCSKSETIYLSLSHILASIYILSVDAKLVLASNTDVSKIKLGINLMWRCMFRNTVTNI